MTQGPLDQWTVEIVSRLDEATELESDFEHLQAATGNKLPFSSFAWQMAWCRHFPDRDPAIVDQPMFHVVRDARRECVAIIPLVLTTRRLAHLKVSSLGWLGADPAITEIRTALVKPGSEERVALLLDTRLRNTADWDWIQWIAGEGEFAAALTRVRGLRWQPLPPSYVLDLPEDWESFRAGLKRNIRESLRHCYNSLKRDGLTFDFQVVTAPAHVRPALDRLFELHRLRAAMADTVAHPDRFESSQVRSFMHDVCEQLAARGNLRLFQLSIGGQIVASRIAFMIADSLYLYYSGFDPAWARYSVMTTTVAESIKYAIAHGAKTVNLSPGMDVSKTRWGPRELMQQTAYEHSGRLRSRLVRHAYLKARTGEGVQGWLLQHLIPGRRTWN